jgi:hypothetical protein
MLASSLCLAGCGQPAKHSEASGPSPSAASQPSPRDVATSFHTALARLHPSGAPTEAQRAELAPLVSREFLTLLARADSVRTAARRAAPSEKPPFTDGDLFSSLFEGPTSFAASEAESIAVGAWRVPVALEHARRHATDALDRHAARARRSRPPRGVRCALRRDVGLRLEGLTARRTAARSRRSALSSEGCDAPRE